MYAAVKKVIREQELRGRLELELERQRLEQILQLQHELRSLSLQKSSDQSQDSDGGGGAETEIQIAIPLLLGRESRRRLQRQKSSLAAPAQEFGFIDSGILTTFRTHKTERSVGRELGSKGRSTRVSIEEPGAASCIIPESSRQPPTNPEAVNQQVAITISSPPNFEKGQRPGQTQGSRVLFSVGVVITLLGLILMGVAYARKSDGTQLGLLMGVGGLVSFLSGIGLILLGINVSILPEFLCRCSSCFGLAPADAPPGSSVIVVPDEPGEIPGTSSPPPSL